MLSWGKAGGGSEGPFRVGERRGPSAEVGKPRSVVLCGARTGVGCAVKRFVFLTLPGDLLLLPSLCPPAEPRAWRAVQGIWASGGQAPARDLTSPAPPPYPGAATAELAAPGQLRAASGLPLARHYLPQAADGNRLPVLPGSGDAPRPVAPFFFFF